MITATSSPDRFGSLLRGLLKKKAVENLSIELPEMPALYQEHLKALFEL